MKYEGWYQVAFERDLTNDLTPTAVGTRPLVLSRTPGGVRAFDGICPHRGAHLAYGGCLEDGAIVCPFHGYRIGLGKRSRHGFSVREYRTLAVGGSIFVLTSESHENGLTELMTELGRTHCIVPGFAVQAHTAPEIVIENGFDNAHFKSVHGVLNQPDFTIQQSQHGEFHVEGSLEFQLPPWQRRGERHGVVLVPFTARAFSPCLAVTHLSGDSPYWVITGATPLTNGSCVVLLSFAIPRSADNADPPSEFCQQLMRYSKAGLEQDCLIWNHMSLTSPSRFTVQDEAVLGFRKFCERFRLEASADLLGSATDPATVRRQATQTAEETP
jgi:3-ketosteroid 9alpha-monooxygenase subunit A